MKKMTQAEVEQALAEQEAQWAEAEKALKGMPECQIQIAKQWIGELDEATNTKPAAPAAPLPWFAIPG